MKTHINGNIVIKKPSTHHQSTRPKPRNIDAITNIAVTQMDGPLCSQLSRPGHRESNTDTQQPQQIKQQNQQVQQRSL